MQTTMMPLRHSFFKLFNDSMSGPKCSWTCGAFSMVEKRREKWEKHLPPCVPDKTRERQGQREGYDEMRSNVFYDMGACCSAAFKMLLTGSRGGGGDIIGSMWRRSTEKQGDQHTHKYTLTVYIHTCEGLVLLIPFVLTNVKDDSGLLQLGF